MKFGGTTNHSSFPTLVALGVLASSLAFSSAASAKKSAEKAPAPKDEKAEKDAEPSEEAKSAPADEEAAPAAAGEDAGASASVGTAGAGAAAAGATGNSIVFLDFGLRSDSGTFQQEEIVGRAVITDEITDIKALGPMLHFGFLTRIAPKFRLGAAFGYGFNYNLTERLTPEEREAEQDPNRFQLGQLIAADIRLEFAQALAGPVSLLVVPQIGFQTILPGGGLQDEVTSVEETHNVGARIGFFGGGDVGIRYQFNDWLSFRGTVGYQYVWQRVHKATRNSETADSDREWQSKTSRVSPLLGVETNF